MKYRDKLAQMTDEELHQEMVKTVRLANWGVLAVAICAVITLATAVVVAILS